MNFYVRLYEFVNLNLCYPKNFVLCILVQCINLCPVIYKRLRVTQLHWVMNSGSKRSEGWYPCYRSWRHPGHSWRHHRLELEAIQVRFQISWIKKSAHMKQLFIYNLSNIRHGVPHACFITPCIELGVVNGSVTYWWRHYLLKQIRHY